MAAAAGGTANAKGEAQSKRLLADAIIDAARIVDNGNYNTIAGIKELKAVLRAHGQMKGNSQVHQKDKLHTLVMGLVGDGTITEPTVEVMAASDEMDAAASDDDEEGEETDEDESEEDSS